MMKKKRYYVIDCPNCREKNSVLLTHSEYKTDYEFNVSKCSHCKYQMGIDEFFKNHYKSGDLKEANQIITDLVDKYICNRNSEHCFVTSITPEGIPDYWQHALDYVEILNNYYCLKCDGTTKNSDCCDNPSCPNMPCCGKPKDDCYCDVILENEINVDFKDKDRQISVALRAAGLIETDDHQITLDCMLNIIDHINNSKNDVTLMEVIKIQDAVYDMYKELLDESYEKATEQIKS